MEISGFTEKNINFLQSAKFIKGTAYVRNTISKKKKKQCGVKRKWIIIKIYIMTMKVSDIFFGIFPKFLKTE